MKRSDASPDRLRPFLIIASYPESILTFRGALIRTLLGAGQQVHVAAPGMALEDPIRLSLEGVGVRVHDVPFCRTGRNLFSDLRLVICLYRLMRAIRPAVVLAYTIKPVIYGTFAAWLARVPRRYALVTGLGYAFTGSRSGLLPRLIRVLYRASLARAGKVFFQNPDDRNLLREIGILSADKPTIVLNGSGVDVSEFLEAPIPKGPPVFLMIARLLGDKGVREYAEAARRVRAGRPEIRFGLVGWIDHNPDAITRKELDAWVLDGGVDFYGKLADVRQCIAACSVYVLPSYREGTPRTVLEAMAMGRPIITTDAPGCRETVIDSENGFLVPVRSVDALVEAMLKFIHDPSLCQRMGRRSRELAEEKYDVHKVNAVMLREMDISGVATGREARA